MAASEDLGLGSWADVGGRHMGPPELFPAAESEGWKIKWGPFFSGHSVFLMLCLSVPQSRCEDSRPHIGGRKSLHHGTADVFSGGFCHGSQTFS